MSAPLSRGTEHRHLHRLHSLVGLAISLVLLLVVFTAPVVAGEPDVLPPIEGPLIDPELIPPTRLTSPSPPPPVPLPQTTVDNDVEVETELVAIALDMTASVPPPSPLEAPSATVLPMPPPAPPLPPVQEVVDEVVEFLPIGDAPQLIGGLAGLQERVEYPELARRGEIEGLLFVQFVVDEQGRVVDPVVVRSPSDLLSEAALKAVQESRFTPGQQRGRPVKVRYSLPVRFVLR